MIFPGGIIIVTIIIFTIGLCFSVAIGCLGGAISYRLFESIAHKTNLYRRIVRGERVDCPWWINENNWFFIGGCLTTLVIAYTITGPCFAFIEWLK